LTGFHAFKRRKCGKGPKSGGKGGGVLNVGGRGNLDKKGMVQGGGEGEVLWEKEPSCPANTFCGRGSREDRVRGKVEKGNTISKAIKNKRSTTTEGTETKRGRVHSKKKEGIDLGKKNTKEEKKLKRNRNTERKTIGNRVRVLKGYPCEETGKVRHEKRFQNFGRLRGSGSKMERKGGNREEKKKSPALQKPARVRKKEAKKRQEQKKKKSDATTE